MRKLGDERAEMRRIEERLLWIVRELAAPLPDGCHYNLSKVNKRAPFRLHLDINSRAEEKEDARDEHHDGRDSQAQCPAHIALNIDYEGRGDHDRNGEGKIVPIEEAADSFLSRFSVGIKLVSTKGKVAWPDAARSDH